MNPEKEQELPQQKLGGRGVHSIAGRESMQCLVFRETQAIFPPETEEEVAKGPGEGSPGAYTAAVWGGGGC